MFEQVSPAGLGLSRYLMQLWRSKSYPTKSRVDKSLTRYRRNSSSTDTHGYDMTATVYGKAYRELLCIAAKLKHDSHPSKFGHPLPTESSSPGSKEGLFNLRMMTLSRQFGSRSNSIVHEGVTTQFQGTPCHIRPTHTRAYKLRTNDCWS